MMFDIIVVESVAITVPVLFWLLKMYPQNLQATCMQSNTCILGTLEQVEGHSTFSSAMAKLHQTTHGLVRGFLNADLLLLGWLVAMEYEEMVVKGGLIYIVFFSGF